MAGLHAQRDAPLLGGTDQGKSLAGREVNNVAPDLKGSKEEES